MLPNSGGISPITIVSLLVFSVVFLFLVGIGTYLTVMRLQYKNRIIIYRDINGRPEATEKDWAKEKVLENGSTAFLLRKKKKVIPAGYIQMGRRVFWYYVRADDLWDNVDALKLGEYYDQKSPVAINSKALLYAHNQLRGNLEKRYNKVNWIDKYLGIIVYTTLIIFTGLMMWLLFREWLTLTGVVTQTVETANQILDRSAELLNAMDNVCTPGSGPGFTQTA